MKDRSGHDFRYGINNKKIKKLVGKKIYQKNFEKNLEYTIDWYLKNMQMLKKKVLKNN